MDKEVERILDVKVDGSKLLVTKNNKFFECRYRSPVPGEDIQLGEDNMLVSVLRSCHGMACATEGLSRPNAQEWTRLSRTVERV